MKTTINIFIGIILLFFLFRDGPHFYIFLENALPFPKSITSNFVSRMKEIISAVLKGNLLVSAIQGTAVGIGFFITGIPNVFLWGSIAAILSLIPIVGTSIVWIPGSLYLVFFEDSIGWAAVLAIYSLSMFLFLENIIKPKLLDKKLGMHPIFLFLAIIGGIAEFGITGVVLGPLFVTLFMTIWSIYHIWESESETIEEDSLSQHLLFSAARSTLIMHTDGQVLSVTRLNQIIRETLLHNDGIQNIWIEGEIFNVTYHSSGHIYFSMKDTQSLINCTFFKNVNYRFRDIKLSEGMQILARGGISVYLQRGQYQFNVLSVMPVGEGQLRLKIEALKKKLHKEGLFEYSRKKPLPILPITLGVATAPTGAAFQDVIRVSRSRFPEINIILAPCLVQGQEAPASIVEAISALNDPDLNVDVIIAGRGGGSFEDLLAFNDENVVRAFASSNVPIVSAVGHEIDQPITDLAADVFAPTPSAAAEKVVPVYIEILERIEELTLRLYISLRNRHRHSKEKFVKILKSPIYHEPRIILEQYQQTLDLSSKDVYTSMREVVNSHMVLFNKFNVLDALFNSNMVRFNKRFSVAEERLYSFSPMATLNRGYAVVRNTHKSVIRKSTDTSKNEKLEILLSKGKLNVKVLDIKKSTEVNNV